MGIEVNLESDINIYPVLNELEIEYLNKFANYRRMKREEGPYYVDGSESFIFQDVKDKNIINYNSPPLGQPSLNCQWMATKDGKKLETFSLLTDHAYIEWIQYLIEHFIGSNPIAQKELPFLQKHIVHGKCKVSYCNSDDEKPIFINYVRKTPTFR